MDLKGLTAVELGKKIQAKEVTVKEAVEACFAQIDKVEKEVPIRTRFTLAKAWLSKLGIPVDSLL